MTKMENLTLDECFSQDESVQMRLYTMSKQQFAVVIGVFFFTLFLFLFIGLAGPPITTTVTHPFSHSDQFNSTDLSRGPFVLRTPLISAYCQQLWVMAQLITNEDQGSTYSSTFDVSVGIRGIETSGDPSPTAIRTGNRTHKLFCKGQTVVTVFKGGKDVYPETHRYQSCQEFVLLHLGALEFGRYELNVNFYNLHKFSDKFGISDIIFYYKSYNPIFSKLEIWVRFLFVVITFGISIWYYQGLRVYAVSFWAMEQKWMALLLPLLLLYNNPLFPLVFVSTNPLGSILDGWFQATFLCGLMLFWLCIYHGVRQSARPFLSFYFPKIVLVGLFWFTASILTIWDRFNEVKNPGWYSNDLETGHFVSLKIFFFVMGSVYLFYLLLLIVRAYAELRNLPYFDLRLKFFTLLMLLVIAVTVGLTFTKFGIAPSLEDNFVSSLSTEHSTSVDFMGSYALLNFYLYTMAFVYSPNPNSAAEFFFKESPETLLNDSEDELLYNSSEYAPGSSRIDQDDESD